MATVSEKQKKGFVITLIAILTGAIVVTNIGDTYYCAEEDSVKECVRLSSTMRTCYWIDADLDETRDLCSGGGIWRPITDFVQFPVNSEKLTGERIEIQRPIVMTEAKVYKDLGDIKYIEGFCRSSLI